MRFLNEIEMNKEFRKINDELGIQKNKFSILIKGIAMISSYDQSNKVQCHQVKNISITFIKQEPNGVSVLMNAKNQHVHFGGDWTSLSISKNTNSHDGAIKGSQKRCRAL